MGLFNSKNRRSPFSSEFHRRTLHKNLQFTATEQYKLLRANLEFTIPEGTKCPVIGVTSSMRGEGKSVSVSKAIPAGLKYASLVKFNESEGKVEK